MNKSKNIKILSNSLCVNYSNYNNINKDSLMMLNLERVLLPTLVSYNSKINKWGDSFFNFIRPRTKGGYKGW
jgi:hypothetical protein